MLDNIAVDSRGHVMLQEDPGGQNYLARIWQYDIKRDSLTEVATFDPELFTPGRPGFLTNDEESAGIVDAEKLLGTGWYLFDAQVRKANPDPELVEHGQLLALFVPFRSRGRKRRRLSRRRGPARRPRRTLARAPLDGPARSAHDERGERGHPVVSWAHQRSRELADQFLDDAHSFRERLAGAADVLRRAGLVFVDTVVELPAACRERLTAIAHGAARAGSNAVAATLDAAWAVGQAARWVRARRGRLLALGGAPLVSALAVLVALSARPEEDPSQRAVLAVRQDTALAAAVHPIREALATRRPAAAVAPSGARVRPLVRAPKRVATPVAVTPAPAAQPARATTKPETAAPPAVVKPRRAPAPAAPARPAPLKTAPASVPHPETAFPPHEPTQPPAAEQPSPPAAAPAVSTAVADEEEDDDRGDDNKRRKGKSKSGHDDRDEDHDDDDDDDDGDDDRRHGDEDDD